MRIAGIGLVFSRGRGVEALEGALREGWAAPRQVSVPYLGDEAFPAYTVDPAVLAEKAVMGKIRRADRFSQMATVAAWDALRDSGIEITDRSRVGVILSTGLGPHVTTFRVLDDILQFGDAGVSPTTFSHSVHNSAASYITSALDLRGPSLTVSQFQFSFAEALDAARCWLEERRCDALLVGGVEENGAVLDYVCAQKLGVARDGCIRPFDFPARPACVPGEGAVFMLLVRDATPKTYGLVEGVERGTGVPALTTDLQLLDADGMAADETPYSRVVRSDVPAASYTPLVGSSMSASAFQCAAAALMLSRQTVYANPVEGSPSGWRLAVAGAAELHRVSCTRCGCRGERATIYLTRA